MERKIFETEDGSHSVMIPGTNLTYHSRHGAIQESMHIFIGAGLLPMLQKKPSTFRIFEMGFGTGLNALLTMAESEMHSTEIFYHAIDLYFLPEAITSKLNFCQRFNMHKWESLFHEMHSAGIGKKTRLSPQFSFLKSKIDVRTAVIEENINLVYYDAFAPDEQPELWTLKIFEKIYSCLSSGGLLVTYSAKGEVRRALEQVGFNVKKLPGPPGKREFIVAKKGVLRK